MKLLYCKECDRYFSRGGVWFVENEVRINVYCGHQAEIKELESCPHVWKLIERRADGQLHRTCVLCGEDQQGVVTFDGQQVTPFKPLS